MAKVVTPITATVEFITAEKQGEYGPYRSVLFLDPAGEKIWKSFNPDADELGYLTKGTRVQLVPTAEKNGKVSHNIVLIDAPTAPAPTQQQATQANGTGLSPEQKREIAAYIDGQADLLRYCWQTAQSKLGDLELSEESIRCASSTLFISAQKKFHL